MANLSDHGEEGVSLFPMFNILACTLGVMVFVLATVAVVSLGADKAIEFVVDLTLGEEQPQGEMSGRSPAWVEWDGLDMMLRPSGSSVRFARDLRSIETFDLTYDYMFSQLAGTPVGAELSDVTADPDRYVILLVRPSGFKTIPEVRGYLDLLGIDVVLEPIDQDWRRLQVR